MVVDILQITLKKIRMEPDDYFCDKCGAIKKYDPELKEWICIDCSLNLIK